LAIVTQGKTDVVLSPQALVSCDPNDFGCQGGYLDKSWDYLVGTGIPSDADYPYTSGDGDSGSCTDDESNQHFKASTYSSFSDEQSIKEDIQANGPVETGFDVYADFMSYSGGIYQYDGVSGLLGGHAVKIIGWGEESGTKYWIVANSWNTGWGEDGFFKIEIGQCCNFESEVIGGTPDVSRIFKKNLKHHH